MVDACANARSGGTLSTTMTTPAARGWQRSIPSTTKGAEKSHSGFWKIHVIAERSAAERSTGNIDANAVMHRQIRRGCQSSGWWRDLRFGL
jgi:hypothetical protein